MYGLDTILEVRKMASEKGMNVTDISRETGISRMTIYKFLEKKDFNSSQTRKSNGKTVVDLQEIRKEVREDSPVDTDTAPTDGQKARDDEAQAAPPAEKGSDDGMGPVRALLGNGGQGNSKERPSKLDPYKPFIITCLMADKKVNRKQRYTDKKILELIRKQGYEGGHTIFDDFVRKVRKALKTYRQKHDPEGYIPLVHFRGEAQADFGKARFEEDGLSYDGSFFVLSFPFSNAGYLQQHFGENQECLLESLKAIFEHLGGVPREIWFDNASAIVTKILDGGERQMTERFCRFREHYGFKTVFMNPESGWEKGNVERKVSYLRNNVLVPVPKFRSLSEFNEKEAFEKCEERIQKDVHYRLNVPVSSLFEEDKAAFLPLPSIPFDTADYVIVHTDKWGLFKLNRGRHIYSSAPDRNEADLLVKITATHVVVMETNGRHIVTHPRLYGGDKDRMESIDYVPYLKFIARKPRSFFNSPIREMMPPGLVSYLDSLSNGERGKVLSELAVMAVSEGFGKAVDTICERLKGMAATAQGAGSNGHGHSDRLDIPYALEPDPAAKVGNG